MSKKKIIEIGIRIYGLYLLVNIPMVLVGLVSVFAIDNSQFVKNPILYQAWAIISPIIYLLIAITLLTKAENISRIIVGKNEQEQVENNKGKLTYTRLSFWIMLLGLYFLVTSISAILRDVFRYSNYAGDSFTFSLLVSQGAMLIAALYMTFKSENVEAFILKKSKDKS